ncbi:PAS domain S-box protein [Flavobacterium degerlachei]|jgi:PAS domain S-box-containing protein|uniref:PAS/PAC sensor signal transduction histidine kinase n=1 Tax=Flavobacterium degerlachei TaxID=229203 RepID=A0A1H2YGA8_9FLAO|nr:PAS domain S-box protein [Flavobacterium degerlachei]SDX04233.1 PAS/PAC sensor signal transduction histidine kinase [Flavobacterium degerlachei]
MKNSEFNFDEDSFNKLFPFYILIDYDLKIKGFGKSLAKALPLIKLNDDFAASFRVKRPHIESDTFENIISIFNQLVLIGTASEDIDLRGQFQEHNGSILFVGSPWFVSMDQVREKKLTLHDFAFHDPLLDLLHVLKTQEITTQELKELLIKINNQKKALDRDQEELNRLSLVASANENGVVFTKPSGEIFWCNDAYLQLTGYSKEEVIGKTPILLGKCDETTEEELLKMTVPFLNGEPFNVEHLHRRKDNKNFWVRTKGQPILDSDGKVIQYFAMIEDVTEDKKHEEILRIEKEKYSNIIANMNLGLIEVDEDERIVLANNSFCNFSGYSLEELIGKNASSLLLTEESKTIIKEKNELRVKGITDSYEIQVKNKKGELRHWLISGAPNYDINGIVTGSIGIHLDITEQKAQEESLYLLSLIAEKNINAVIISDIEGKIEWVNSSFEKMSGYSIMESVGNKPGHLLQGQETNPETVAYLSAQIRKGQPFACEIVNYSKSGDKYWVKIQGQALYNKKGEIVRYFAIEENISNKKLLENQREELVASLAKTNKELEDYAQIVSHDLKSPLRSIHSLISWIKEDNDKAFSDQTLKYFSMMENKVEKMDRLIEGILTYSKIDKENIAVEKVNTQLIIQSIIEIIHIPKHITVTIKNTLPIINADRYRIQQLFQNIIGNAVNYIEREVGLVEISSEEFDTYYVFAVKDNGVGIAEKNHEKIFNTFQSYTTSEHSTGLGLSIVKKVIETYKGKIWIESEEGVGTTFFIKLNK